jgi:small subunit ribosomal protein S15
MAIAAESKKQIVAEHRKHEKDSGSPEVQIAVITAQVEALAEHLKDHAKDHASRRGLILMVGRRNRLLRYLSRTDPESYHSLIGRLGLRK